MVSSTLEGGSAGGGQCETARFSTVEARAAAEAEEWRAARGARGRTCHSELVSQGPGARERSQVSGPRGPGPRVSKLCVYIRDSPVHNGAPYLYM